MMMEHTEYTPQIQSILEIELNEDDIDEAKEIREEAFEFLRDTSLAELLHVQSILQSRVKFLLAQRMFDLE